MATKDKDPPPNTTKLGIGAPEAPLDRLPSPPEVPEARSTLTSEPPPPEPRAQQRAAFPSVERGAPALDEEPPSSRQSHRARLRPTLEDLERFAAELLLGEQELLAGILAQQLGRAGKTPTGRYIAKTGLKVSRSGKAHRITASAVLHEQDKAPKGEPFLTPTEIEEFTARRAIEPEYA